MMSAFFQQQKTNNNSNREIDFLEQEIWQFSFFLISPNEKKTGENWAVILGGVPAPVKTQYILYKGETIPTHTLIKCQLINAAVITSNY